MAHHVILLMGQEALYATAHHGTILMDQGALFAMAHYVVVALAVGPHLMTEAEAHCRWGVLQVLCAEKSLALSTEVHLVFLLYFILEVEAVVRSDHQWAI